MKVEVHWGFEPQLGIHLCKWTECPEGKRRKFEDTHGYALYFCFPFVEVILKWKRTRVWTAREIITYEKLWRDNNIEWQLKNGTLY